jgi:hypothetical protein
MEESPKKLLIGLIIGTMVIFSIMLMVDRLLVVNPTVLGTEYDSFKERMNQSVELDKSVTKLQSLVGNSTGSGSNPITTIGSTLWNGVKYMFSSVSFFNSMLSSLSELLGLPSWVGTLLFMVVTLLLVFWLVEMIFRAV